ncbi:atherin-like [Schistocerca americana]|uniref:atherin-like n=1 Tax=Schistocerca americana TaxID=7009 RepID=UPI001F4FBDF6|nr:atherin-like [Schistocerca americana]
MAPEAHKGDISSRLPETSRAPRRTGPHSSGQIAFSGRPACAVARRARKAVAVRRLAADRAVASTSRLLTSDACTAADIGCRAAARGASEDVRSAEPLAAAAPALAASRVSPPPPPPLPPSPPPLDAEWTPTPLFTTAACSHTTPTLRHAPHPPPMTAAAGAGCNYRCLRSRGPVNIKAARRGRGTPAGCFSALCSEPLPVPCGGKGREDRLPVWQAGRGFGGERPVEESPDSRDRARPAQLSPLLALTERARRSGSSGNRFCRGRRHPPPRTARLPLAASQVLGHFIRVSLPPYTAAAQSTSAWTSVGSVRQE